MSNTPPLQPGGSPALRIKKYPNRRFYDATRSRHVTADDLYELVRAGHSIEVTDSQTGQDITSQVLTQMILERDAAKLGLFSAPLLHQVIQSNQQILQSFLERYFNQALQVFLGSQQQFETALRQAGVPEPNLAAFQWMRSFMPAMPGAPGSAPTPFVTPEEPAAPRETDAIVELRAQLAEMAERLSQLQTEAAPQTGRGGPRRPGRKPAARNARRKNKS